MLTFATFFVIRKKGTIHFDWCIDSLVISKVCVAIRVPVSIPKEAYKSHLLLTAGANTKLRWMLPFLLQEAHMAVNTLF